MVTFEVTQTGEIPAEKISRAILGAETRAVGLAIRELRANLDGRMVQARSRRLIDAVEAQITRGGGEFVARIGFNKDVAFIARFLELGTTRHEIPRPGSRGKLRVTGWGATAEAKAVRKSRGKRRARKTMKFSAGGRVLFRRHVEVEGVPAHFFMKATRDAIEQPIRDDFERSIGDALNA